jgi:phosphate-selective porin OprO/OprP
MFSAMARLRSLALSAAIGLIASGAWTSAEAADSAAPAQQGPAPMPAGSPQPAASQYYSQQAAAPAPVPYPYGAAPAVPAAATVPTEQSPISTTMSQEEIKRIDNLERTVRQLNEIVNAQQEQQTKSSAVKVSTKGGLLVESEDGQFSFQPIGRLHIDGAWYNQDKEKLGDGWLVRRARIGVTGKMFGDWVYKIEPDFGGDTNKVSMAEAFIKYVGWAPADFAIGNVPVPFGLEQYTSDNFITFIERALPSPVFAPERLLGVVGNYFGPNYSFSSGFYGPKVANSAALTTPTDGDHQNVFTARATYEPILEKDRLLHFGFGFLWEDPGNQNVSFSSKPESNVTGQTFVNTGANITDTTHLLMFNPEFSGTYGPVNVEGEYFFVPISRDNLQDVDFTGWYAQVSYFLTGESRNYNPKSAKFDRVSPNHNLGKGGWGAFEVAGRVSNLNLDDEDIHGGTERNYTIGLNWYANPYIRFMANYVWVFTNANNQGTSALIPPNTTHAYDDPSVFEIRAQVDF